jgi:hypothetical protein
VSFELTRLRTTLHPAMRVVVVASTVAVDTIAMIMLVAVAVMVTFQTTISLSSNN